MRITEEELEELLHSFDGNLIQKQSYFKTICLGFFPNNVVPSFHADIPFDSTNILSNYKTYYQRNESTFLAFICYNLIKTMQNETFSFLRYRYINDQWYCFNQLPLFVSVKVNDLSVQQVFFFIERAGSMSWDEFSNAYASGVAKYRQLQEGMTPPHPGWYNVSHQVTGLPFDFTGYTPSQKHNDSNAHAPWFVVSHRQSTNKGVHFTLSCTCSHASCLPSELDGFLESFRHNLLCVPDQQKITRYFQKITDDPIKSLLSPKLFKPQHSKILKSPIPIIEAPKDSSHKFFGLKNISGNSEELNSMRHYCGYK